MAQSFAALKVSYTRHNVEWAYDRMVLVKQMHAKAQCWEAAVWDAYRQLAPKDNVELPEKHLPPVLKHIVIKAQERAAALS